MTPPSPRLLGAVALAGAVGALLRWVLGETFPDGSGFPWTTFAVNVVGSAALGALPVLQVVRQRPALAAALGPGLLGGFTTVSAWSEQSRALLATQPATGAAYVLATVVASVTAAALGSRLAARA